MSRNFFLACWALQGMVAMAAEPSLGPVVEHYGPTFPVDERDVPVDKSMAYRVVFDAGDPVGSDADLNAELVSVARFLNMHVRSGVSLAQLDVAVVLHGNALKSALSDDAYRDRFAVDNPNLRLLSALADAGVDFFACGQSMGFQEMEKRELLTSVQVALSAMTMLAALQSDGYALLP